MAAPFACGQYTLATGAGATQDFTVAGETRTPVAALFQWSGATALSTNTNHAVLSLGATDGTREFFGSPISETGVALSDSYTLHNTDAVIVHLDGAGAIVGQLSFNSFIAGGIRLDRDTAPAAAWIGQIFFFFEGSYRVDTFTTGATAGVATSVTTTGVAPPTFLVVHEFGDQVFGATVQSHARFSLGFAADNGADLQAGALWSDQDNVTTTAAVAVTDNATASGFITPVGATNATVSYAFTASGFDATPQLQNLAHNIGYLAGDIPGVSVWAGHLTFPTAAGAHDFTEAGFPVSGGLVCQTALTSEVLATGGATEGIGSGMFDTITQASLDVQTDDNRNAVLNNTLTRCYVTNVLFDLHAPPTTTLLAASHTGISATGFTVNVTTNPAATRLMPALLFGVQAEYLPADDTLELADDPRIVIFNRVFEDSDTLELADDPRVVVFTHEFASEDTLELADDPRVFVYNTIFEDSDTLELSETDYVVTFNPPAVSESGQAGRSGMEAGQSGRSGMERGQAKGSQ